jgi:hypothetical protein
MSYDVTSVNPGSITVSNPLLTFQDRGGTGILSANGATLFIGNVNGMASVAVTASGASYIGVILPQLQNGDGNWINTTGQIPGNGSGLITGPGTQNMVVNVGGWQQMRLVTVFFSGTAMIAWNGGAGYNAALPPYTTSNVAAVIGSGSTFKNITGATTIVIKNTPGLLYAVCCNSLVNAATLKLYDNTGASGTVISTSTLSAIVAGNTWSPTTQNYWGLQFANGLVAVTTGTADWTVMYK